MFNITYLSLCLYTDGNLEHDLQFKWVGTGDDAIQRDNDISLPEYYISNMDIGDCTMFYITGNSNPGNYIHVCTLSYDCHNHDYYYVIQFQGELNLELS